MHTRKEYSHSYLILTFEYSCKLITMRTSVVRLVNLHVPCGRGCRSGRPPAQGQSGWVGGSWLGAGSHKPYFRSCRSSWMEGTSRG